eukprot:GFUD01023089.1.p1 GENE.GFUD01023089.1~~GFUD01023089.1.p1  ORF type:complete len:151 (-),score=42.80 GFUD01023089.1:78-530(-)
MINKQLTKSLLVLSLVIVLCLGQDQFQQCCKNRRLYYGGDGQCYLPLQQGPCEQGEWIIMEKGGSGLGICRKTPCESNIEFLKDGQCIFGVDLTKRGLLCEGNMRPWYSVYGEWECKTRYLSLPFGSISDKTTQDPVWQDCKSYVKLIWL